MKSQNSYKTILKSMLKKFLQQMLMYKHRYKSRKALLNLDDRMLTDIGVSKDTALHEAQKPFWKGESSIFDMNEYTRLKKRIYLDKKAKSRGVSF